MPYSLVGNTPIIYIHIPKTGGTTLKHYFELPLSGHLTAQQSYALHHLYRSEWRPSYLEDPPAECPWLRYDAVIEKVQKLNEIILKEHREQGRTRWQCAYKFSFVRNPWDRLASMFHHHREDFGGLGEFKDLLEKLKNPGTMLGQSNLRHTQTQYLVVPFANPAMQLQFIGRYEDLANDAQRAYKTLTGNEKILTTWQRRSANKDREYTKMYVDFNHIYEVFSLYYADIQNFNYTFTNAKDCQITRECFERHEREKNLV